MCDLFATMTSFQFKVPSSIMIVGPSGSGKTVFVKKMLKNRKTMFSRQIKRIKYCYGAWQDGFNEMKKMGVDFHQGLPEVPMSHKSFFPKNQRPGLLILDDVMAEAVKSQRVVDIFTKESHHNDFVCVYLSQAMFPPGKYQRTISTNCNYIIAFKNPRDGLGVSTLASQAFPGESAEILEAFKDATHNPHTYLMFDFHPTTSDEERLKVNVIPGEGVYSVYKKDTHYDSDSEYQPKKKKQRRK